MTLSNFVSKLNWRLIAIHFIAYLFFIHAAEDFFFLYDFKLRMDLIKTGSNHNVHALFKVISNDLGANAVSKFVYLSLWFNLIEYLSILIVFFISLLISIKQHWYWVNSVIVFIAEFLLLRFRLISLPYLDNLFRFPRMFFKYDNPWAYITNGLVMLSIGLLLLFLKKSIQIINHNAPHNQLN